MEEYLSVRLLTSVQTIGDLENFLCISAHSNPNYQRVEQRIIGLLCLGILTRIPNSKNIISRQAGNSRVGRLVFWLITKIRSSFCVLKVTQILQLLCHHNTNVIAGEKLWFFYNNCDTGKGSTFTSSERWCNITYVTSHKKICFLSTLQGFSLLSNKTAITTWNPYNLIGIHYA